ncbi:MAG TPA: hypothetical protein VGI40_16190 [Pirellulaceae bacterium]|jgi:hypothetical protein
MNQTRPTFEPAITSKPAPRYSPKMVLLIMATLAAAYLLLLTYLHFNAEADLRRIFGGPAGLAAVRYPDRVEAYRIGKLADEAKWPATPADFPILAGPVAAPPPNVADLSRTLQDRNYYMWNKSRDCAPHPDIRLDFTHDNDRLSVLVCFECNMITSYLNDKPVSEMISDYLRPALVRAARSLFPNDPKIQALSEQP